MKKIILPLLILSVSISSFAHTISTDVKPQFKFFLDKSKKEEHTHNYLKVVPEEIYGFTKAQGEKEKMMESFKIIEEVINSREFKNKVIGFVGKGPLGGFTSNNDLTNEEIYEFLMLGKELIGGEETLGEMNLNISRYWPWYRSAVIGRTRPGKSKWIEVNGQHYSKMTVTQMASNITHEWIHLKGFYHANASDHHSVPYAVGYIMEELAEKYLAQGYID